jgi:hypothetical protein
MMVGGLPPAGVGVDVAVASSALPHSLLDLADPVWRERLDGLTGM